MRLSFIERGRGRDQWALQGACWVGLWVEGVSGAHCWVSISFWLLAGCSGDSSGGVVGKEDCKRAVVRTEAVLQGCVCAMACDKAWSCGRLQRSEQQTVSLVPLPDCKMPLNACCPGLYLCGTSSGRTPPPP